MSTAALNMTPLLPKAAPMILDMAEFGEGFVALLSVGHQGESDWQFRFALSFLDDQLECSRFLWLDQLPLQDSSQSHWQEGNWRLSTGSDTRIGISKRSGRGLWIDGETLEILAIDSSPLSPEGKVPGLSAAYSSWRDDGSALGILPIAKPPAKQLVLRTLARTDSQSGSAPQNWQRLDDFSVKSLGIGLHQPWICQVSSLGQAGWLLSIVTDGSVKSAYPSKSIGFGYCIVDHQGKFLATLDHAAASEAIAVNVYDSTGDPIFPSSEHPFYPVRFDAPRKRIFHKLLNQLIIFGIDGSLVHQVNFSDKGLSGMRKLELMAVSRSGWGVFYDRAKAAIWSVELGDNQNISKNLAKGLKEHQKSLKALGGGRLPPMALDIQASQLSPLL